MANAKRTSDITVALYEWNKLTTRNIAEDEKEYFNGGIEFIWEGKTPEIDEEVLVYNPIDERNERDEYERFPEQGKRSGEDIAEGRAQALEKFKNRLFHKKLRSVC